jgi:hypothetical protein
MSPEAKALPEFSMKIRRGRYHDDSRMQQLKELPGIMASSELRCKPSFLTAIILDDDLLPGTFLT